MYCSYANKVEATLDPKSHSLSQNSDHHARDVYYIQFIYSVLAPTYDRSNPTGKFSAEAEVVMQHQPCYYIQFKFSFAA